MNPPSVMTGRAATRAENGMPVIPVQFWPGLSMPAHRNVPKTLRKLLASFSCCTASTVKVRRKNASSAALAHSVSRFEVLSMTALSQGPNRGFNRGDIECSQ